MWMLGNLNKQTRQTMKELGLQMSVNKLYNTKRPSLKDAVVSFGGFCSGVVVSGDGLVFTNHHCGFSSIQQHSSVEHDYLKDGFVARNLSEELPNPELYVRFLLHQQDVTRRVLGAVKPDMNESERTSVVDSVMLVIGEEVSRKDSTLIGIVDAYYGGNEFWLSVYRDYNDVRLVFAPPSSVGKFGWDTDNWVWPRHTGDFAVFRIYAGKDNRPADYSPDNVPYHPEYVAPISLDGYREGSFCMTMGYPGSTERYLSSFGIEEMMTTTNQAQIDVRGVKQAIWKREMDSRDSIRIKYTGVTWADRKVFDSSWQKGASVAVTMNGVVPGFAQALEGQTVGSQILAVIPPELGYGAEGSGTIPGDATLVFVIDILGIDAPASS